MAFKLPFNFTSFTSCMLGSVHPRLNTQGPLSELHRETIRKCRASLVKDLDVVEIMDEMIQAGIINDYSRQSIISKPIRQDQVGTFLDILMRSGSNAFEVFHKSLEESYPHLAEILRATLQREFEEAPYNDVAISESPYHDNCLYNPSTYQNQTIQKNDIAKHNHSTTACNDDESNKPTGDGGNECYYLRYPHEYSSVMSCNDGKNPNDAMKNRRSERDTSTSRQTSDRDLVGHGKNEDTFLQQEDDKFVKHITGKVAEDVCYQSIGTQTLICTENCTAIVIRKASTMGSSRSHQNLSNPNDDSHVYRRTDLYNTQTTEANAKPQETASVLKGDSLFLEQTQKWSFCGETPDDVRVWDIRGRLLLVPSRVLTLYGDPCGEPWFYALPLTAQQAGLILRSFSKPGVFIVSLPREGNEATKTVKFNLSLLVKKSNSLKAMHYHIDSSSKGRVELLGSNFSCIQELITYYRSEKGKLPCRLQHPPEEVDREIKEGVHYDKNWFIDSEELEFPHGTSKSASRNVVLAYHNLKEVAVKYRSSRHRLDPWSYEKFFEEAEILRQLDHKHIVQLYGFSFASKDKPFIVMENLPGGTLLEAIKSKKVERNLGSIVKLLKQILEALSYLESKHYVIHCNIAAQNILFGEYLKLADFGMARQVMEDGFMVDEKDTYTVRWSAPEVQQAGWYSTKSDMWSFGVVCWEILSDGKGAPYGNIPSPQITELLQDGVRLGCPGGHSADVRDIFKLIAKRCWNAMAVNRSSASMLLEMIGNRLCNHNESGRQAALAADLDLPDDFTFLTAKEMRQGRYQVKKKAATANREGYSYINLGQCDINEPPEYLHL